MDLSTIIMFLIFSTIIYVPIANAYRTFKLANSNNCTISLKATVDHNNRTLHFTKGKIYTFYKTGTTLMINEDDTSRDRDNYVFYKDDLDDHFVSTDLLSNLVLNKVQYLR